MIGENEVLKRVRWPNGEKVIEEQKKLSSEELHNFHSAPNIGTRNVPCFKEIKNTRKCLVWTLKPDPAFQSPYQNKVKWNIWLFTAGDAVSVNQYPGVVVNQMYEIANGEWCRTKPTLISNGYDSSIALNVLINILQMGLDSKVPCCNNTLTFLAYFFNEQGKTGSSTMFVRMYLSIWLICGQINFNRTCY